MTTKEYLSQITALNVKIEHKLAEIDQLKSMLLNVRLVAGGERVQSSGSQDKLGDSLARVVDLDGEIAETIDALIAARKEIITRIEGISDLASNQVLFMRYVENKSFDEIADTIGYSKRQVIRIHDCALVDFEKIYGKSYENA